MIVNRLPARAGLGFQAVQLSPSVNMSLSWKDFLLAGLLLVLAYQLFFSRSAKRGRKVRGEARAEYRKQLAESRKKYREALKLA